MLKKQEIELMREKLLKAERPMFFFDDDVDGVSSFVMLYNMTGKGKGICVKGKPVLEEKYSKKVEEYQPDMIFILDKPLVEQAFIDKSLEGSDREIFWLDHHPVQHPKNVTYLNPRIHDDSDNSPTSYLAYLISREDLHDSLWIAMVGIVGDWTLLMADEFRSKYPGLLPPEITKPEEALFNSKLGDLIHILNFNLKGSTSEVMKSIKILTRIDSPYEILNQTSSRGRYLFRKALPISRKYEELRNKVKVTDDKFIIFTYEDNKLAVSSDLSNEFLYRYPDKVIVIARKKAHDVNMAIRSGRHKIVDRLKTALEGVDGYGGGHDYACGASVKNSDFDRFIQNFKGQFGEGA